MELRVLGPVEASAGAQSIDLGARMQRAVLCLLATEANRVVSLDRIVDSLWGERPPATATTALYGYIAGLRRALDPGRSARAPSQIIVTEPPGYVLRLPAHAIDAARFEALAAKGEVFLATGRPAGAYDLFGRALGLWRGTAYEDLAFESFLQAEIARLTELRATATESRAEAVLALGRHHEAVVDLERMVAADPLRERRWRLLALALYRAGRQADALRTLARARHTLGEGLGLELGPELRRLEHDILVQAPVLEWRAPVEQSSTGSLRMPLLDAPIAVTSLLSPVRETAPEPASISPVLPPDACPLGFSLTDMAIAVAPFTMSGNDPARYPETPFQLLHVDAFDVRVVGTGTVLMGTNSFTATAETPYYTLIVTANDEPPIVGVFPSGPEDADAYLFDPEQYGAREIEVVVDGTVTLIGPKYVTGPVPISGDEPVRIITLGVFIGPMRPGSHQVIVRGALFGRSFRETYGVSFMQLELLYDVEVVASHRSPHPGTT